MLWSACIVRLMLGVLLFSLAMIPQVALEPGVWLPFTSCGL